MVLGIVKVFRYVQVPFKIGFTVVVIFSKYVAFIDMVYGKYLILYVQYIDFLFRTFSCYLNTHRINPKCMAVLGY